MRFAQIAAGLALLAAAPSAQVTIHVPADEPTIQAGIAAAGDGDTVLVAAGTYFEHDVDFLGRAITVASDAGAELTTVDAEGLGRGFVFASGEQLDSVLDGFTITGGVAPDTEHGGGIGVSDAAPTIRNCRLVGNTATNGGGLGVRCVEGSCAPLVEDCVFDANLASGSTGFGSGGGIAVLSAAPTIARCIVTNNHAGDGVFVGGDGGGLYVLGSTDAPSAPSFLDCIVSGNEAGDGGSVPFGTPDGGRGGGAFVINADAAFLRCRFDGNRAGDGGSLDPPGAGGAGGPGGGIAVTGGTSSIRVLDCVVVHNAAGTGGAGVTTGPGGQGGGVALLGGVFSYPTAEIVNSTLTGNAAGPSATGGGLVVIDNGVATLRNSILFGDVVDEIALSGLGDASATYTNVEGGWPGQGNVDVDPLFVDAAAGDVRLMSASACIDAGDPTTAGISATDVEGEPRAQGGGVDMGAHEAPAVAAVLPYGCGINPVDSLFVLAGMPLLDTTLELGVDNPLDTQAPGSIPFVAISLMPDPAYPCGTPLLRWGMGSEPGELLLLVPPQGEVFLIHEGDPWTGAGQAAPVVLTIPDAPVLLGTSVYAQGALIDATLPQSPEMGLTGALELRFGD